MTSPNLDRFLKRADVEAATGLSKPTLYRRMAAGEFPKPVTLGARSVRWLESEVKAWQLAQLEKRAA